ncbi:MAG TPA: branched-chain amino acid ABC transporter permease [Gaiellaceae bacterium]|nr:branched-chain amino acid ABC transporter permease [Gaiellaceae bacterium]
MASSAGSRARASVRGYRERATRASGLSRVGEWWRSRPERTRSWIPVAIVVTLAVLYPFYVDNLPTNIPIIEQFPPLHDTVTILVFVMMAVGLNIVVGYAGLLDLGYVAFYAIGAYTAGWLASGQFQQVHFAFGAIGVQRNAGGIHISIWLVLLVAAIVTAIGGILIGLPTLRLRGDYLAIVTLGFGEIIPQFVRNADNLHGFNLTGGTFGINPIDQLGFGSTLHKAIGLPVTYTAYYPPKPDRYFYWTILALLLFTLFCSMRLRDSRLGRAWIAIREDETAAGAMGVPLMRTKTWSYAGGAFFGGIAGAYIATFNSGAFPTQFDFNISVFLLCMVVLGGMGSLWGVVVAGTILAWLNFDGLGNIGSWLNTNIIPSSHQIDVPKYSFGIYGVIIVLMMLFRPTGLIPERRRKREIEEGTRGPLDEPLYEMRGADEPGAGERGAAGSIPRG